MIVPTATTFASALRLILPMCIAERPGAAPSHSFKVLWGQFRLSLISLVMEIQLTESYLEYLEQVMLTE